MSMTEVLTRSGVSISVQTGSPLMDTILGIATSAFGGIVANEEGTTDTVADIIAQQAVDTTLTDTVGNVYVLNEEGWDHPLPNLDLIVNATMPGGWSWNR